MSKNTINDAYEDDDAKCLRRAFNITGLGMIAAGVSIAVFTTGTPLLAVGVMCAAGGIAFMGIAKIFEAIDKGNLQAGPDLEELAKKGYTSTFSL